MIIVLGSIDPPRGKVPMTTDPAIDKTLSSCTCDPTNLRQVVTVRISLPYNKRSVDKAAIRHKDVSIDSANWDDAVIFCPTCLRNDREAKTISRQLLLDRIKELEAKLQTLCPHANSPSVGLCSDCGASMGSTPKDGGA